MKSPLLSLGVIEVLIFLIQISYAENSLRSEALGFLPFSLTQLACWLNTSLSFFLTFKISTIDSVYLKIYYRWESHSPLISLCNSFFTRKMSVYKYKLQISCKYRLQIQAANLMMLHETIRNDDFQHNIYSVATLLRHCFQQLQHCSNIATMCCAKNRRCESPV